MGINMGIPRQRNNALHVAPSGFSILFFSVFIVGCLAHSLPAFAAGAPVPVATDSRIKTFVYSENDVFNVVTHYGYQSNIEFGQNEEVETLSLGDRVPFQVMPSGRRLFIRALLANARTNMTVITNKHAYQFDLVSVPAPVTPNEELVYVVRFFYPGDKKNSAAQYSDGMKAEPVSVMPASAPADKVAYNYDYTFTGNDEIAPLKVFDDGKSTYFKLRTIGNAAPTVSVIDDSGKENLVPSSNNGEYWVVNAVSSRFGIRQDEYKVTVYNERLAHN